MASNKQRALKWFDSFVGNRQQKCLVNSELSGARAVTFGVPQKSLLFLIYINDSPSKASPWMYSDDTISATPRCFYQNLNQH